MGDEFKLNTLIKEFAQIMSLTPISKEKLQIGKLNELGSEKKELNIPVFDKSSVTEGPLKIE